MGRPGRAGLRDGSQRHLPGRGAAGPAAARLTACSNDIGDPQLVPDEVLAAGVDRMVRVALDAIVTLAAADTQ